MKKENVFELQPDERLTLRSDSWTSIRLVNILDRHSGLTLGFMTVSPTLLAALIFGNGVVGGVAIEYGKWLKAQKNGGLIFGLTNGFLNGVILGIYFGLSVFLLTGALFALGWLVLTPIQMASLTFAVCILMFVTYEYSQWLDMQSTTSSTKATPAG